MEDQMSDGRFEYTKDKYTEKCEVCGAIYNVEVIGQNGHEETEEYKCPECNSVHTIRASRSPIVSLVSKRTDKSI